ncbi:hypothetical protein PSCFBP3800_04034 [Pseudomonas syringae group genomosp. 3]|uniref:Uncharacterized protein n=1 Tax=Pseudomonas amygdali pv. morsprunorum TaxID=129138 RepID=A0A3M2WS29_PSEA0|nr:hypothetical protein ALQ94_00586 [Pseudomonas amygdali pv. morsprunorum]SPF19494.1 hypothetical protein PSCFBP3800_04034 [Pseudomonas syringae group genomosp. 3]
MTPSVFDSQSSWTSPLPQVRDLSGTGSKTSKYGTSVATEVTGFRAASQPVAAIVTS